MDETPKKPWWRKKRWWAAAAVLLAMPIYPLSAAPFIYCETRGWLPEGVYDTLYAPAWYVARRTPLDRTYRRYASYWRGLGVRHQEAAGPHQH